MRSIKTLLSACALAGSIALALGACNSPSSNGSNTANPSNSKNVAANSASEANKSLAPGPTGSPISLCDPVVNKQIITDLVNAYSNDSVIQPQMKHFNATSVNCVVTLYGYAEPTPVFDKVITVTRAASKSIQGLNILNFYDTPKIASHGPNCGCPGGTHACGDICIPDGEDCMWGLCLEPVATATRTP